MINKTVRVLNFENDHNKVHDINFIAESLQTVNYNVSRASIGCSQAVFQEELEKSIKCNDVVLLLGEANFVRSIALWEVLSKVFHQTIVANRISNTYATMYSKLLEQRGVSPVIYLQGLFVLDSEVLRPTFLNIVLPILENFSAKLVVSRVLVVDYAKNEETLQLLPRDDKVHVAYVSAPDGACNVHLNSTSMSALLAYEKRVVKMFRNAECHVGSDLSELVYNQPDLHIRHSVEVIEECFKRYSPENVFVSFNGGKDCTVLLHLILGVLKRNYPNFSQKLFCVYIENTEPFSQLNTFIEECKHYYNLHILKLNKPIKESLSSVLETKPNMKGVLMGTRRTDPFSSHLDSFHMTDKGWPQVMRVSPLLDWHYSQIWDYLLHLKVPYCSLYDSGYTSLGSATNTIPNPVLRVDNGYLPAYKLLDASKERSGRKC